METTDVGRLLQEMGCARGQGFLLARPTAGEALEPLLASGRVLQTSVVPEAVALGTGGVRV
jgi:EAL domain-containing protein (putative c-di-GMP-specific phosphodiesterase class I)